MRLVERVRAWIRRSDEDAEMDQELRFHLEMETEQNVRAGMQPSEARRQATLDFGGVERWRERIREARAPLAAEGFVRDLRHAGRSLRRSPAFLVGGVLALGLGIGATPRSSRPCGRWCSPPHLWSRIPARWSWSERSTRSPARAGE